MTHWPGHAVLQVPVVGLDDFVRGRFQHHDPDLVGISDLLGEDFVHAHVTVLGPFDALPDRHQVQRLAATWAPFDAFCGRVATFPNGIIHAPVEPASSFTHMTATAQDAFGGVKPYRGQFDVSPHVTLDAVAEGVDADTVAAQLSDVLPLAFRAEVVDLVWYEQGATRLVARIDLA